MASVFYKYSNQGESVDVKASSCGSPEDVELFLLWDGKDGTKSFLEGSEDHDCVTRWVGRYRRSLGSKGTRKLAAKREMLGGLPFLRDPKRPCS